MDHGEGTITAGPDKYSRKTMFPLVGLDRGVGTNYHGVPVE